jgi:CRP-like cAMP-binding protein
MAGEKRILKGDVLILQGNQSRDLFILQQGGLEILSTPEEFLGLDKEIVLSKSKRIGVIKQKGYIAGFNEQLIGPYKATIRAIEDSMVSQISLSDRGIAQLAASDSSQTTIMLKQLVTRLVTAVNESAGFNKLYHLVNIVFDNISLMYFDITASNAQQQLHVYAEKIYNTYTENSGSLPQEFNTRFLVTDVSRFLGKKYALPAGPMDSPAMKKVFNFIQRMCSLNDSLFTSCIKADPGFAVDLYDLLSDLYLKALDRNTSVMRTIDDRLRALLDAQNSWTSYLTDKQQGNTRFHQRLPDPAGNHKYQL